MLTRSDNNVHLRFQRQLHNLPTSTFAFDDSYTLISKFTSPLDGYTF